MADNFSTPEWTTDEWLQAWHIGVGSTYRCRQCSNMVMVIKGGTGNLDPRCHGQPMAPVETRR